uniref:Uncharacterized protein n=1 Tax=Brassica campestris TaxID=3711 RepID=M4F2Q2_BRACM
MSIDSTVNTFQHVLSEGRLFLNATSATHFYFDKECDAGRSYLERGGEGNDNPTDDFPGAGAVKISHIDGLKGTAVEDGGFVPYGDAAGGTGEPVDPSKTSVDGRSKSEDGTEHESG